MELDIISNFLAVLLLSCLALTYRIRKFTKTGDNSTKKTRAPEPSGAWPFIGHLHLLCGSQQPVARTLGAMADKYGPIFSLRLGGTPALVISGWEMVKDCFTTNDIVFASRPANAVRKYFYNYAVFALSPYGPYWRDVRKMVTVELLTSHRLKELERVRASEVNNYIRDLYFQYANSYNDGDQCKVINISKWFQHLTMDITIKTLAGKRLSGMNSGNHEEDDVRFKEAVERALYLIGAFVPSDTIPSIEWMDIGRYITSMKQTAKEIDTVIEQWLEEHIQKNNGGTVDDGEKDFMDVMLSTIREDATMSGHRRDTIIKATTLILILTGSESTSDTLIWALSLLLNNHQMLERAQEELDSNVGRNRWVEESDIKNLTYLQAIVKETLRLYPPGPLSGPREAAEDCYVGGYFVPKGTRLIVNLWKLHRDPRIWSEPMKFLPERFLVDHANVTFRGQNYEYIPFSSGRRMCPAVNFGLLVVHLTLARLLQGFDLSTSMAMPVDMSEGLGIALPKIKPAEIIVKPRLSLDLYKEL
uniref:Cytochrome P450 n=1 Tax=Nothapodytes nimmoniana TaxID=159386 RepID=A0A7L7RB93_NOTNI|nr:cytochrome P450 [Nothapodytes nimmoniana]